PRQAPRARAPALTGIVILLMRPDRTRQALGFLKKTQSHESGFGAGFWSHECVLCRPKTSRVGVARFLSGPLAAIARRLLASDVTEMLPGQDLEQVVLRAGLGQVLALLDDAFAVRVGAGRAGLQGGDSNHSNSCHVRRGSPDPAVRPAGGLQVTRRRSGTGRPAVAEDGRVRRPCPNQAPPAVLSPTGRRRPRSSSSGADSRARGSRRSHCWGGRAARVRTIAIAGHSPPVWCARRWPRRIGRA